MAALGKRKKYWLERVGDYFDSFLDISWSNASSMKNSKTWELNDIGFFRILLMKKLLELCRIFFFCQSYICFNIILSAHFIFL